MSLYRVVGPLRYLDHDIGEMFETDLDPEQEQRALRAGTIVVVERARTGLRAGSWDLPDRWRQRNNQEHMTAPEGAVSMKGV